MLESSLTSCNKQVEAAAYMVEKINTPFTASIFHRSFFEIMTYWQYTILKIIISDYVKYLRDYGSEENSIYYKQNESGWHNKHCSWIKFPSGPVLSVIPSEVFVLFVPDWVNLSEPLCSCPSKFYCHKSYDCLYNKVNEYRLQCFLLETILNLAE